MFGQKPVLGLVDTYRQESGAALVGMHPLHQTAVGGPDVGLSGALLKPKDLVRLLLAHGARIRRSTAPRCGLTLHVLTPSGHSAVEINL